MIADQHKVLVGRGDVEEAQELRGGDIDVCHMSVFTVDTGGVVISFTKPHI